MKLVITAEDGSICTDRSGRCDMNALTGAALGVVDALISVQRTFIEEASDAAKAKDRLEQKAGMTREAKAAADVWSAMLRDSTAYASMQDSTAKEDRQ